MTVDGTDKMNLFGQYAGAAITLDNVKNFNGFGAESGSYGYFYNVEYVTTLGTNAFDFSEIHSPNDMTISRTMRVIIDAYSIDVNVFCHGNDKCIIYYFGYQDNSNYVLSCGANATCYEYYNNWTFNSLPPPTSEPTQLPSTNPTYYPTRVPIDSSTTTTTASTTSTTSITSMKTSTTITSATSMTNAINSTKNATNTRTITTIMTNDDTSTTLIHMDTRNTTNMDSVSNSKYNNIEMNTTQLANNGFENHVHINIAVQCFVNKILELNVYKL